MYPYLCCASANIHLQSYASSLGTGHNSGTRVNKEHREEDNMPKKGTKSKDKVDDVPNERENKLPDYLELQRTRVVCNADAPIHVDTFTTLLSCIC